MEPTKYFIVCVDMADYSRAIAAEGLDRGRCFSCATLAEARRGYARNLRLGIPAVILRTPAWTHAHGMAERAERGRVA